MFGRRKTKRQLSVNFLEYVMDGEGGDSSCRGMGRTRNISRAGLLLETPAPLKSGQVLRMTIGLEKETVEILGHVVHVEPFDEDWYWSGIEFQGLDSRAREVLENYLSLLSRRN